MQNQDFKNTSLDATYLFSGIGNNPLLMGTNFYKLIDAPIVPRTKQPNSWKIQTCGIYKITSPTGKIYIGQSVYIEKRFSRYKTLKCKKQHKILASLLKYGADFHTFEIIKICNEEDLNYWECYYIEKYDCFNTPHGLNLESGGKVYRKISDETRERISISQKERYKTQPHPNKGKQMSLEQRKKLSDHNLGNKHTEETKLKMSTSHKGKVRSPEHQEKLNMTRRGKPPRKVKCSYCEKEISFLLINRWHNENCKLKK